MINIEARRNNCTAREMDIDMAEAIMRVELGSEVVKMSSKELKRDLLLFARRQP